MNLFTLMELKYPTGVNFKGLLASNPDQTVAYAKPAYAAAQNVFSVFDDTLRRLPEFPFTSTVASPRKLALSACAKTSGGGQVVAFWFSDAPPVESTATSAVDLVLARGEFAVPVLVDLRTGQVYGVPAKNWSRTSAGTSFRQIPVYDSPMLLAEASALRLSTARP